MFFLTIQYFYHIVLMLVRAAEVGFVVCVCVYDNRDQMNWFGVGSMYLVILLLMGLVLQGGLASRRSGGCLVAHSVISVTGMKMGQEMIFGYVAQWRVGGDARRLNAHLSIPSGLC